MLRSIKKGLGMSVLLMGVSLGAQAELVNADWMAGDGKAAMDTETNKGWLDFSETAGYSMNTIVQELGKGGQFEGWRLPTQQEVEALFISAMPQWALNAGEEQRLRKNSSQLRYQNANVQNFRAALGYKYLYYTSTSSRGFQTAGWLLDDAGNTMLTGAYRHHYWNGPYDEVYFNLTSEGKYTADNRNSYTGVWLVVDNASVRLGGEQGLKDVDSVTSVLGAGAFMGLFAAALRRKKRPQLV